MSYSIRRLCQKVWFLNYVRKFGLQLLGPLFRAHQENSNKDKRTLSALGMQPIDCLLLHVLRLASKWLLHRAISLHAFLVGLALPFSAVLLFQVMKKATNAPVCSNRFSVLRTVRAHAVSAACLIIVARLQLSIVSSRQFVCSGGQRPESLQQRWKIRRCYRPTSGITTSR